MDLYIFQRRFVGGWGMGQERTHNVFVEDVDNVDITVVAELHKDSQV